jgi:DNA transformation protein
VGIKGDKGTIEASLSVELFLDKLIQISGITSKKMFGGFGIFHEGKMFALVNSKGAIHIKFDDSIKQKFIDSGSNQHGKMPYYSLPQDVLQDQDKLVQWAKESMDISK